MTETGNLETDIAILASVRESLGTRAELRFDGRRRYPFDDARRLGSALEQANVSMWIDPLSPRDREHLPRLARQCQVPVAVAAGIGSPRDVLEVAREEGVRAVVLAPEQLGGMSAVRSATAVADAAGLTAALGGRASLGLGVAARLQLAAAVPRLAIGNECAAPDLRDDILTTPLVANDGMLAVPSEPGLGVTVDRAQLERWQVN
jgi:L-alanine-DL-glutamate epimerase-like enolase superfamily enzyme